MTNLTINCDGGARGNPGPAAAAFVVRNSKGVTVHQQGFYLGHATNNQAEYQAVLFALEWWGKNYPQSDASFYLDSLLVVNQINGIFKIKEPNLKQKYLLIQSKLSNLKNNKYKFAYIPREKNYYADKIVNETLDKSTL